MMIFEKDDIKKLRTELGKDDICIYVQKIQQGMQRPKLYMWIFVQWNKSYVNC